MLSTKRSAMGVLRNPTGSAISSGGFQPQERFVRMLALERKRTERSHNCFVLMLLNIKAIEDRIVLLLRERLRTLQWVPLGLATVGVLYLTFAYGSLPWIALVLASSPNPFAYQEISLWLAGSIVDRPKPRRS